MLLCLQPSQASNDFRENITLSRHYELHTYPLFNIFIVCVSSSLGEIFKNLIFFYLQVLLLTHSEVTADGAFYFQTYLKQRKLQGLS